MGLQAMTAVSSARGMTLDRQKVRNLRRQRGMTQAHFANAAGISEDTISRAERGQSVSMENAMAIAAAFGTTVADLAVLPAETQKSAAVAMSNIPIRVPTHFMGRDDALADIETAMQRHHGRVAITALHGLRGVGKTVLAAAYAERHRHDYRATWWLRAETEAGMRADLVGLGVRLGWAGADDKEEPALAAIIERLGHGGDGILLIFDNAVDADSLAPYLPHGGAARVLVTSNYHAWRGTAEPVEIRLWPKEVGADYLIARTGRNAERKEAEDLSVALGGLPLAHEQAAAYCERLELSLAEYARRFAAEPAKLLDTDKDAPAEYHDKMTVAKTFALAIDAAAKLQPAAELLIVYAALLAPEPIPLFLFAEGRGKFSEPLSSLLAGDGLDEAVAALRAFALIDRETIADERDPAISTPTIRLHRLVREVAAARHTRDDARRALMEVVAAIYPLNVDHDPITWLRSRRLDALALDLVLGDATLPKGTELWACGLMNQLAVYRCRALGDYSSARSLLERALGINEAFFGPRHLATARSLNNLAGMCWEQGDLAASRPLLERALAIDEEAFGPDHPEVATDLNNLGLLLADQGDLATARSLNERGLAIREKCLGAEHPDTAVSLTSSGTLCRRDGDLVGARLLYERALAIREKVFGLEHPDTADSLNNLAVVREEQGDRVVPGPLFERSLAIFEKVLGPEHPRTALVRRNLGRFIAKCG
jgi:transcriptional regulator with XRE-family HTH domain/tetratricopeptide (TPR) repeat protein